MQRKQLMAWWMGALLLAVLGGCATPRHPVPAKAPDAQALGVLPTFRGDGTRASMEDVVASASEADVVLIGENHGHPVGLAWAALVFDRVLGRAEKAGLGLEFFERDEQSRVDDYLRGLADEKTFRKRTERTLGSYPEGHRQMLEAAKAKGRPVIAANAPRAMIRYLRGKDYDALRGLTAEQQRLFRVPDSLPEGKYRDDFYALMRGALEGEAGHGGGQAGGAATLSDEEMAAKLEGRLRAQSLWDWTMGESVVRGLEGGARPMVQVVGRFHSDFRGGLAQAIEKMRPGVRVLVVSVVDEDAKTLRDEDRGRGDFVVYVGPSAEK